MCIFVLRKLNMMSRFWMVLVCVLVLTDMRGQGVRLGLPNRELLSSERVVQVLQDSEGFLWYATEGGGLCRDDGCRVLVFRCDAEHPDLLGSNEVSCLAEAAGRYMVVGTSKGACVLDKRDYGIRRLAEVDEKRVDDVVVAADGHWWLTANKRVYEYTGEGVWLKTYAAGDRYLNRLHVDRQGRVWASEWGGGLLQCDGTRFVPAPWPLDVPPTSIEEDAASLMIGTVGKGVVRYHSEDGSVELMEPADSFCMSRMTRDAQGRRMVVDGWGHCFVLSDKEQSSWFEGRILTKHVADSIRGRLNLSARPTGLTTDKAGDLWFSTGKDVRRMKQGKETVVLPDTRDVSAMAFTSDGTLWLATIYGTVMSYREGKLSTDEYASNEFSDAIIHLEADGAGRLLMVSDRYIRIYDTVHRTLRQQSREAEGFYRIELMETAPGERWSQPLTDVAEERMPTWVWGMMAVFVLVLVGLMAYIGFLRRQRKRFLALMMKEGETKGEKPTEAVEECPLIVDEWLQRAIAQLEAHLSDDSYTVEQLASDLCMSRMTFYRKIQSATGQKPTEFMRTIRLRRAAELLREGRMSITQITYDTGFASVSYFSRCFRAMYGVSPTQFSKEATATK